MKKLTTEEVIDRSNKVHNFFYDYSNTIYVNKRTHIIVTCPIHGDFSVDPKLHWSGQKCKQCDLELRSEYYKNKYEIDFYERAIKIHGEKYNYDKVKYEKSLKKVIITCPIHGDFSVTPNSHLNNKTGCKKCGNDYNCFNKQNWIDKANGRYGIFYIIKCFDNDEVFYKFGITFRSVKTRYNNLPYNYEIIREITTDDLSYIWELEKRFKKFKLNNLYIPLKKFEGSSSECFK
jgi:hypothetical protein